MGELARRSIPLHNDEAHDCPTDLPAWKARQVGKPPWKARDPRERQEMIYWMIQQLEEIEVLKGTNPEERAALRKRFHLAKFLLPPEPPRQRKKRDDDLANWALNAAVDTVPFIRQIWQEEYDRKNRHPDDGASAEEIAAYLFDVNIDHVMSRSRKPSGGPRGKRKPARGK